MMTQTEHKKLADIKRRALACEFVSPSEKQWVLDLARREGEGIHAATIAVEAKQGYNVRGMRTK